MAGFESRRRWFPLTFLVWLAFIGCGGSFFFSSNNGRLLLFVSVNPTNVDGVHFINGQVPFTATGTFNMAPITVNSINNVIWTVDRAAFSTMPDLGHATISPDGVAQCTPGFTGSVTIFATAAADPTQPVSLSNQKVGTAQLLCP
jgi:sorbitol-specific phosphotransferase system component IIA